MITSDPQPTELNWAKSTFLVVDRKSLFHNMVQTALVGAGAKSVKHATSVEKAVEILNRYGQEITCVICEWDISPVGGLELLRKIRTRGLSKTSPLTPVIVLTARADAAAVKASMAMDVNGFAVAPLSIEKLIRTVSQALGRLWALQEPSHYAAVPCVATTQAPEPAMSQTTRDHARRADGGRATPQRIPGSPPAPPQPRRQDELKNVHMCVLRDVRPGQVLARDLLDRDGHLLLSAGAVLKSTLIDRLTNVAQGHTDSYHLWIGEREESLRLEHPLRAG